MDRLMDGMGVPVPVLAVMDGLIKVGFQAYLVGGCVRDLLLDEEPKDYDVTTNARPDQVASIFPKVIPTGERFGTVTVHGDMDVEVTTFRKDGSYLDGRRPESVSYSETLAEDVSRRDFTVNALAMSREGEVIDLVDGTKDLEQRLIRCVGNPVERFREDALRMLRAIRFECQIDGRIEAQTREAIGSCSGLISNVSMERVRDELCKILVTKRAAGGILTLEECGLLEYVLPEVHVCAEFDRNNNIGKAIFSHTLLAVRHSPPRLVVRLAAVLHDIGKPANYNAELDYAIDHHIAGARLTVQAMERLRFDRHTIETVAVLVREHMSRYDFLRVKDAREFVRRVGKKNLDDLFDLQIADVKASRGPHDFSKIDALRREVAGVLQRQDPLTIEDLAVDGNDLQAWGVKPGPEMGRTLDLMLDRVLEDPSMNTKDRLRQVFEDLQNR